MAIIESVVGWLRSHPAITGWAFGASLLLFVGSLITMPLLIARMRADYFVSRKPSEESWSGRHGAVRLVTLVVKNGVGLVLLFAGIAMLALPGQGILTMLVGISLLNFPWKRRLELRIVRQRHVRRAIRWMRMRSNRPPLILPERDPD